MELTSYEDVVEQARGSGEELVLVERMNDRVVVTMNDPPTLNALSPALTVQLLNALRDLAVDPAVRTVVLTGADPAFSAGGDIRAMEGVAHPLVDQTRQGATGMWRWIRYQFGGVVRVIARTDKVFIAAVNGACAGVGAAFALACDLIFASERARFLSSFGQIGLLPEVGTSWLLTRRLGYQKAFELYLSGREVSGTEAAAMGIANEVVPHDDLLARAHEWCDRIAALPEHAVTMTKPLLRSAADMTWEQAIVMEEFAEPLCFTTTDHRDAVRAFLGNG